MKDLIVFFSHGSDKRREKHIKFFRTLLLDIFGEKNVLESENSTEITMYKATLKKIDKSDMVFAVFTKEYLLKHKTKDDKNIVKCFKVSPGTIYETGYAKAVAGVGIPVHGVREEGITIYETGMFHFNALSGEDSSVFCPDFPSSINDLKIKEDHFRKIITNRKAELEDEMKTPYRFLNAEKKIKIDNTGYGIVHIRRKVIVKYDEPDLSFCNHKFEATLDKETELPPFDSIKLQNPFEAYRKKEAFFSIALVKNIKGTVSSIDIEDVEFTRPNKSSVELKFVLKAQGPFQRGDIFIYEYVIGLPNMHSPSVASHDTSFFFPSEDTDELTFTLKFEHGLNFLEEPSYEIIARESGNLTKNKQLFDKSNEVLYTTFIKTIQTKVGGLPGGRIKANWIFK